MDITTELILDHLPKEMHARLLGKMRPFPLKRPKLFSPQKKLQDRHIYVMLAENFPALPIDSAYEMKILLICVGHMTRRPYIRENLTVILVEDGSIWDVFNEVSEIYERYMQWSSDLDAILSSDTDLTDMVRISLPILENSIAILDKNLYHLAIAYGSSDPVTGETCWDVNGPTAPLPVERISALKEQLKASRFKKEPYMRDENTFSVNLYIDGEYEGVASLIAWKHPFLQSDFAVFCYLAAQVEKVMARKARLLTGQAAPLKDIALDLLRGNPVSHRRVTQLEHMFAEKERQEFSVVKLKHTHDSALISSSYICTSLEMLLSGSIALEYDAFVVIILEKSTSSYSYEENMKTFGLWLEDFHFKAGVSNGFSDIRALHDYFRQACCALETGMEFCPDASVYYFSDYALTYMALHSVGEFPPRHIAPPGLLKLWELSRSGVDYWGTLRAWLDNILNATQTAKELYLSRSSFLARLDRIKEITGIDFDDMMSIVQVRLLIYLMDMEQDMEGGGNRCTD